MSDLIDRLMRIESSGDPEHSTCHYRNPDGPEAAAEIERLRKQVAELAEAGTGYSQQTVDAITNERERLRDWQRRAIARVQLHNAQLRQRCGEGYSEGVRCGYRPYLLNSGRRCTHCPVYEQIDFDDLMEEATR
jgi:hypothetical protein